MPDPEKPHPEAAKSLDQLAEGLIGRFECRSLQPQAEGGPFPTRKTVGETITDADIIGEPLLGWSDWSGRYVGRYFVLDRQEISLKGESYAALRRLAERIARTKPFKGKLSQQFVEDEVFIWCRAKYRGDSNEAFSDYMTKRAHDEIRSHHLIVPIASIEIEHPFKLGDVRVITLRPDFFAGARAAAEREAPKEGLPYILEHLKEFEKEFLGWTAIEMDLTGERQFVMDEIHAIASDMAAVLRFFTPAAVSATIASPCFPAGGEHIPKRTIIDVHAGGGLSIHGGLLYTALYNHRMPHADLDERMKGGLANLAQFFRRAELTEHQKRVRGALFAYSRGIASYDRNDRLIYAMTAAEHLLLRDASEPIQGNVGERMAFLIANDADSRKAVVASFKAAYALRSKYVHHLASVEEDAALQSFFTNMFVMLFTVVQNMPRFTTHSDFLDEIDRVKFS
jgi:hypothetical protein